MSQAPEVMTRIVPAVYPMIMVVLRRLDGVIAMLVRGLDQVIVLVWEQDLGRDEEQHKCPHGAGEEDRDGSFFLSDNTDESCNKGCHSRERRQAKGDGKCHVAEESITSSFSQMYEKEKNSEADQEAQDGVDRPFAQSGLGQEEFFHLITSCNK